MWLMYICAPVFNFVSLQNEHMPDFVSHCTVWGFENFTWAVPYTFDKMIGRIWRHMGPLWGSVIEIIAGKC